MSRDNAGEEFAMRMGFGLISLLLATALILWLMVGSGYLQTVSSANKHSRTQLNVIGGKSEDGTMLATDTIRYKIVPGSNRSKLIITSIVRDGAMDERYGLRMDDQIIEIGALDTSTVVSSRDDATAFLHDAYARNWPLVVMRSGKKLTLPTPEHIAEVAAKKRAALAAATSQPVNPTTPAAPPAEETPRNPLQDALDSIRK